MGIKEKMKNRKEERKERRKPNLSVWRKMKVLREMEGERRRNESDKYIRWIPYIRERE